LEIYCIWEEFGATLDGGMSQCLSTPFNEATLAFNTQLQTPAHFIHISRHQPHQAYLPLPAASVIAPYFEEAIILLTFELTAGISPPASLDAMTD